VKRLQRLQVFNQVVFFLAAESKIESVSVSEKNAAASSEALRMGVTLKFIFARH